MPRIEQPCPKSWDDLTPDSPTTRACDTCRERVHDLAAIGPVDAARLLRRGGACVRALVSPGGRLVTAPLAVFVLAGTAVPSVDPIPCPEWWADLTEAATLFGWHVDVMDPMVPLLLTLGYAGGPFEPGFARVQLAPGEPARAGVIACDDGPQLVVFEPGVPVDLATCFDHVGEGTATCVSTGASLSCRTVRVLAEPAAGLTEARCGGATVALPPGEAVWLPAGDGCILTLQGQGATIDHGFVHSGDVVRCWAPPVGGVGCT